MFINPPENVEVDDIEDEKLIQVAGNGWNTDLQFSIFKGERTCLRCCVFILHNHRSEYIDKNTFVLPLSEFRKKLNIPEGQEEPDECRLCKGVLQDQCMFEYLKTELSYNKENFDQYSNRESFMFHISGLIDVCATFCDFYSRKFGRKPVDKEFAKKIIKRVYIILLERESNITYFENIPAENQKCHFNIQINFQLSSTPSFKKGRKKRKLKRHSKNTSSESKFPIIEIEYFNNPIFFHGRYRKLQRYVPQTAYSGYSTSVEEEMTRILLPYFNFHKAKFASGGREDIDVRMLGTGRPFAITIQNPKRLDNMKHFAEIVGKINQSKIIQISDVGFSLERSIIKRVCDVKKRKTYRCVVRSKNEVTKETVDRINQIRDLKINQKTPIRVLHRRTPMTREKFIYRMKIEMFNKNYFQLDLETSGGAYVKEFVTSDFGRTFPSLYSLMNDRMNYLDILQLDVTGIQQTE